MYANSRAEELRNGHTHSQGLVMTQKYCYDRRLPLQQSRAVAGGGGVGLKDVTNYQSALSNDGGAAIAVFGICDLPAQ